MPVDGSADGPGGGRCAYLSTSADSAGPVGRVWRHASPTARHGTATGATGRDGTSRPADRWEGETVLVTELRITLQLGG